VWLYFRFPLGFREVEELMLQRGVIVSYETVRCWCAKFRQAYADGLRRRRPRPGASALLAPGMPLAGRGVILRFLRRGADLVEELVGQSSVALVGLGFHLRVQAELLGDALGAHGGPVVHAARPVGAGPQQPAGAVADRGGLGGIPYVVGGLIPVIRKIGKPRSFGGGSWCSCP
jgi:hypothetical protein